jgi:hypothetical protein
MAGRDLVEPGELLEGHPLSLWQWADRG